MEENGKEKIREDERILKKKEIEKWKLRNGKMREREITWNL